MITDLLATEDDEDDGDTEGNCVRVDWRCTRLNFREPEELVNILGAYILSLTGRFAGCRGPVLVAMRSPKSGFSGHGPLCYVRTD